MNQQLPRNAADKLASLTVAADDARALLGSTTERIKGVRDQMAVEADQKNYASLEHELVRLQAMKQQHQRRHADISAVLATIGLWLRRLLPHASLELAKPVQAKPREGETITDAIARIRDEIAVSQQDLHAIKVAPLPKSDLKAKAAQFVDQLAQRGRPKIRSEAGAFNVSFEQQASFTASSPDGMAALLAWFDPAAMKKRFAAEIDALPDNKQALTAPQKEKRVGELTVYIEQLEREEEALIEQGHGQGAEIARRPNASPAAILGVVVGKQKKAAA